jgi:DNA-binding NtrC family response regulator
MSESGTNYPDHDKVLIINDDYSFSHSLCRFLQKKNISAISASSSKEALEFLEKQEVGCVVTDIWMSGIIGTELIQKIKSLYNDIYVVLITGYERYFSQSCIKALGADAHLAKPYVYDKLIDLLNKNFNKTIAGEKFCLEGINK